MMLRISSSWLFLVGQGDDAARALDGQSDQRRAQQASQRHPREHRHELKLRGQQREARSNLQGRNLQQGLTGDDVRLLHSALALLNLSVPDSARRVQHKPLGKSQELRRDMHNKQRAFRQRDQRRAARHSEGRRASGRRCESACSGRHFFHNQPESSRDLVPGRLDRRSPKLLAP
jgi:hypothetical protein